MTSLSAIYSKWRPKKSLYFQGRTVDLKTLTLIEEPAVQTAEELDAAEDEFEKLLRESGE